MENWENGYAFLIRLAPAGPVDQDLSEDSSSRSTDAAHHTVRRVSQGGQSMTERFLEK